MRSVRSLADEWRGGGGGGSHINGDKSDKSEEAAIAGVAPREIPSVRDMCAWRSFLPGSYSDPFA